MDSVLDEQKIPFLLRVRNNSLLEGVFQVNDFFKNLPVRRKSKMQRLLYGDDMFTSAQDGLINKMNLLT